ncbi:MAG: DUF4125 family protein, partial [Ruminococcus sp.]
CQLEKAEEFLNRVISDAMESKDYHNAITLYNEQIGYYRDCGMFEKALLSCEKVSELIYECNLENTPEHATTLLNIANAYRAAGKYDKSFEAYNMVKRIYDSNENTDKMLYSSYYNNISLLYQETQDWTKACECQKKALEIVTEEKDLQKIAISKTNLAISLIRLEKTEEAQKLLSEALDYFYGLTPSDFHFSAALSAMGDILYYKGKYSEAIDFYEMARSETELHMGKNNFYDIISDNIKTAKLKIDYNENITGIELCKKYYEAFGSPMIHRNFAEYEDKITCGMVGEGSDCFGFDDEYSKDHDYGPAFCIWIDDDIYDTVGPQLERAYNLLPKCFMEIKRIDSFQSSKRTGVFRTSEFYASLLGTSKIPQTDSEWLSIPIEKLAVCTNGSIFTNAENQFTEIRNHLINDFPETVRLRHLAQQTALMAQSGQYNFNRMMKRGCIVTSEICFSEFVLASLRCCHLLEGRYYPYYKWLFKSTQNETIKKILCENGKKENIINEVCRTISDIIKSEYDISSQSDYLDVLAHKLSDKADEIFKREKLAMQIAKMEFEAFDEVQNEGGRANCQDDWETFSIMRRSQYLTWNVQMLELYISDFEKARLNGRNLITEKYARMMKSTAPAKYAELESKLPALETDSVKICNAICEIQVGWMEAFSSEYPKLSANARAVHSYEDTEFSTSYETYLRGELLTYSRNMLSMYAQFVVELARKGKNLAYLIMENT